MDPSVAQSAIRDNLSIGEYCLTVTDEQNCEYTSCWTIESEVGEIPKPQLVELNNIPLCLEGGTPDCTGSISIDVPDGATITWLNIPNNNKVNSNIVTDLCVGSYQVEVEKDGCGFVNSFDIVCCFVFSPDSEDSIEPLTVAGNIIQPNEGECNGKIQLQTGINDVVIEWQEPNADQTGKNLDGLCPGLYCVNVSDGCGTTINKCFRIAECSTIGEIIDFEVLNTCGEFNQGKITYIDKSLDLDFIWSTGSTSSSIVGLSAGSYTVTVTAKDCLESEPNVYTFTIDDSGELECEQSEANLETVCIEKCYCNGEFVSEERVFSEYGPVEHGGALLFTGWCRNTFYCGDEFVGYGPKTAYRKKFAWEVGEPVNQDVPCAVYKRCELDQSYFITSEIADEKFDSEGNGFCYVYCRHNIFQQWQIVEATGVECGGCNSCFAPQIPTTITKCPSSEVGETEYYVTGKNIGDSTYINRYDVLLNQNLNSHLEGSDFIRIENQDDCSIILAGNFSNETALSDEHFAQAEIQGESDLFIFKYTEYGELIWTSFFGSNQDDSIANLKIDKDFNIILSGYSGGKLSIQGHEVTSGQGFFVTKFDPNGSIIWNRSISSTREDFKNNTLTELSDNGILVSGSFEKDISLQGDDSVELQQSENKGYYMARFSQEGEVDWFNIVQSEDFLSASTDVSDKSNLIFNSFSFKSQILNLDGSVASNEYSDNMSRMSISCYSNDGVRLWNKIEGDLNGNIEVQRIKAILEDRIVVGAHFNGSIRLSNGDLITSSGQNDIVFICYDEFGEILWADIQGTSSDEYFADMLIDNDSIVYVGYFYGVSTIIENENIDGSSDFPVEFIAKRAINPTDLQGRGASTTRDKIHFSKKNINNVTIQPNPFSDILHISFGNLEISKVDIMNHLGQIVYFNNEVSEDILNINLANLKSNMYIVRCRDKNGEVMDIQKLIKL